MDTERIESFKQFAKYLEYPMVVFEAESGDVLDINYEAEVLLGGKVNNIRIQPGRNFAKLNFWEVLHGKKSLIWHRIRMMADDKEFLVSGLINEMTEAGTLIYTLLFERRADMNIGSVTLERIVNHAGIVAVHMTQDEANPGCLQVEYVSQNINQYGFTRGQLYEKQIGLQDIICPEDFEKLSETLKEDALRHQQDTEIECRILTEERDLIPVRLLVRYIYDDYSNMTDLELLIIDLREEQRRNLENTYLSNTISKMKSVVVVNSYKAGKRKLCYVSPNAGMVGMNVEALRKGYKLTEDYIHPDDRSSVSDAVYQAVANGITDYVQIYRMVRDDGKQIWVENEITVNRVSDGEAEVAFLLTDITERKDMERELAAAIEEDHTSCESAEVSSVNLITIDKEDKDMLYEFQMMADALGRNADYYSVVLDAEGKQLTQPTGPSSDMGLFYDLFERPIFKEEFVALSERAKAQKIPQSVSFEMDNFTVHMVFAPLMLEQMVTAYWVLTSFAKDGDMILGEVAENQWHLANSIAKCFYCQELIQKETRNRKLTEMQLHKEQAERKVIEDIVVCMSRGCDAALPEMCYKIGMYLTVDSIAIYYKNKNSENVEKYFVWNQIGEDSQVIERMELAPAEYQVLTQCFKKESLLVVDSQTEDVYLKELAKRENVVMMIHEMTNSSGEEGYIVFVANEREREFDYIDTHFAATVSKIFESFISSCKKNSRPEVVTTGLLESYDHIRDAVYVKDNRTGDIIFANKATDKLFGYSLVGRRATDIINDKMEQYRNMGGVRRHFIEDRKVTKWQTYMRELDQIMNIVEIHMETLYGQDWSLYILKKNKNKKKDKE